MSFEAVFFALIGIVGAFLTLFGYRLFQVALTVIGATGGALYGYMVVEMASTGDALWPPVAGGVVGLLVGAGGALIVYYLGIFAAGAYLGFWFANSIIEGLELSYPWAVIAGITVLTGLITMIMERWTIIALTSLAGAWHVTASIAYFTDGADLLPYEHPFQGDGPWYQAVDGVSLIWAGALLLLGYFIQKSMTAKRGRGV